jgi:hypothetical protein
MLSGMCLILFVYIDLYIQHSSKIRDIFAHFLMFILGQCAVQINICQAAALPNLL